MKDVLQELKKRRENARLGGGIDRIEAQHSKGKLTARERIEILMDQDLSLIHISEPTRPC